jgi:membrane-associated phospholipid phosphatase
MTDQPNNSSNAGISPGGRLWLHLTVGLLTILMSGWFFADIAEDVSHNEAIVRTDDTVAQWLHQHATPSLTVAAQAASFPGSVGSLTIASAVIALILTSKKFWTWLSIFVVTMVGAGLLNVLLKDLFHRHRPVFENPLVTLNDYGFPSGHTMGATVFCGLLSLFLATLVSSIVSRIAIFMTAALTIVLVGLSRIYLGAHYLSDVVGAFAAGVCWLGFCWSGSQTLIHSQAPRVKRA